MRKASINMPKEIQSLPVEHQLILEEEQNDFDFIIHQSDSDDQPVILAANNKSKINQSSENPSLREKNLQSNSALAIADDTSLNKMGMMYQRVSAMATNDDDYTDVDVLQQMLSDTKDYHNKYIGFLEEVTDEESSIEDYGMGNMQIQSDNDNPTMIQVSE